MAEKQIYKSENLGSGTFVITKPKRKKAKQRQTRLKNLKRGSRKGLFRLESWNAPPREDIKLAWAARVIDIRPR